MPRKQNSTRTSVLHTTRKKEGLFSYFRFGESYTSLILGMVVVILAVILITALFKNRNLSGLINTQPKQDISATQTGPAVDTKKNTYLVQEGDSLWLIAEKTYRNGYNWVDIAKENNIQNPDSIEKGMTLTMPDIIASVTSVDQKPAAQSDIQVANSISGDTYTIQKGDYLWEIAVRAYGDGYRWIQIAKDNNIQNPDLIYSGTVLKLKKT